jgi:hypothetical protein
MYCVGRAQLYQLSLIYAHTVSQNQYIGKKFDSIHFFVKTLSCTYAEVWTVIQYIRGMMQIAIVIQTLKWTVIYFQYYYLFVRVYEAEARTRWGSVGKAARAKNTD